MATTNNSIAVFSDATPLDLSRIKNAALLREAQALDALQARGVSAVKSTASSLDELRREQAIILSRIQSTKLYEKDNFKSLADFAETIGLNKSNAHQLASAGNIYNDKKAPTALKALSPSKLATLSSAIKADKETIYTDAENGKFDNATQAELKQYASEHVNAKKPAQIAKTYCAYYYHNETAIKPEKAHPNADYTMDEWKAYFTSNGSEYIPLPKVKSDTSTGTAIKNRALIITPQKSTYVVFFTQFNPKAKAQNGEAKTFARENAITHLICHGASFDDVNTTMRLMGWDEITSEEYDEIADSDTVQEFINNQ